MYTVARKHFLEWVAIGKPRSGELFSRMCCSREEFKHALCFFRQHEEQLKRDACELSYDSKDPKAFWNAVYRAGNSAVKNNVVNIGNAYGDNDIANMWKAHFSDIYNKLHNDVSKQQFYYRFNESVHNAESCHVIVSVQDIITAINKRHKNKAAC